MLNLEKIVAMLSVILLGRFLFGVWLMGILMLPLGLMMHSRWHQGRMQQVERQYLSQYLDFLSVFAMASSVGRSGLEGFAYCYQELCLIYPQDKSFMLDVKQVMNKTTMDSDIYEIFMEHDFQLPREEVDVFAQMLYLGSKKGGDMDRILSYCSSLLEERVKLERDKEVMLAKQKLELDIIIALPFILLLMMKSLNPSYLETLTGSPLGVVAMSLAFLLMGFAVFLGVQLCRFLPTSP